MIDKEISLEEFRANLVSGFYDVSDVEFLNMLQISMRQLGIIEKDIAHRFSISYKTVNDYLEGRSFPNLLARPLISKWIN